jgi:hypothetical protein
MKLFFSLVVVTFSSLFATAQNVGINVSNPDVNLTVLKDIRLDAQGINDGTIGNSLRFGTEPSGEFILSKRTAGGNQYGFDFFTGGISRLSIDKSGDIFIGQSTSGKLLINGNTVIDNNSQNTGTLDYGIRFGSSGSGEGIASNRNPGVNQYGLDFFTLGTVRLSISLDGVVSIDNNPLLTFAGTGKQVVVNSDAAISSASLAPGSQVSVTYAYLFNNVSGAWAAGFIPVSGDCSKVAISTEIINTSAGHYSIKIYATNISSSAIAFNGKWKLMVLGSY